MWSCHALTIAAALYLFGCQMPPVTQPVAETAPASPEPKYFIEFDQGAGQPIRVSGLTRNFTNGRTVDVKDGTLTFSQGDEIVETQAIEPETTVVIDRDGNVTTRPPQSAHQ
ncbi:hypothetical protein GC163_19875 [bacterium]|nr:hypothetical protein [bacterium]